MFMAIALVVIITILVFKPITVNINVHHKHEVITPPLPAAPELTESERREIDKEKPPTVEELMLGINSIISEMEAGHERK
jgi:hypothetical protein